MKPSAISTLLVVLALAGASSHAAGGPNGDSATFFERMKQLEGEWRGHWEPGGISTTVRYTVTGNGSALVEEYVLEGESRTTMATVYHLDGDRLMLTHYCSIKNQPRMVAAGSFGDQNSATFEFLDITNHSEGGYSRRLELSLIDADRTSVHYTGSRTGRRSGVVLERVR